MPTRLPYGLVLAGGKSTRLGTDKVCLWYSGKIMLMRMLDLAGHFCGEVYVSGRNPEEFEINAPWLADDIPGIGPMGGILTCLRRLNAPLLVLACDLPLLDIATVHTLVRAHAKAPAATVMTTFRQQETGYIESLVSIYTPAAIPLFEDSISRQSYKLTRAIPEHLRHHVPYSRENAGVFFNINFPADLAMLRQVERTQDNR